MNQVPSTHIPMHTVVPPTNSEYLQPSRFSNAPLYVNSQNNLYGSQQNENHGRPVPIYYNPNSTLPAATNYAPQHTMSMPEYTHNCTQYSPAIPSQLNVVPDHVGKSAQNSEYNIAPRDVAEWISEFNPTSREGVSIKRWLESVDQIKLLYNLHDKLILFAVIKKLKGVALDYYESIAKEILEWSQLRERLIEEFYIIRDVTDVHALLKSAKKKSIEKLASEINLEEKYVNTLNIVYPG